MNFPHLTGLIAAPFTPMVPDGSVNVDIIPAYYQLLKTNGVSGAFICGSTGEGVSLSFNEKKAVAEAWAKATAADPEFPVLMFLGGNCLEDCKQLALHAREWDLYAVSFTSPFYFKPANVQMLAECCIEIAAVVPDMPFYYYHIPALTGVNFPMYELLQAVDGKAPNFAGIKYTYEDLMDFSSCKRYKNEKYDMLWGRDEMFLAALALGAKGSVGSTFNYAAPLYQQLTKEFENGNLSAAQHWQQKSIDMIRLLGKYHGIATGKAFMRKIGLDCGAFRRPVKNMSVEQFNKFSHDCDELELEKYFSLLPDVSGAEFAKKIPHS